MPVYGVVDIKNVFTFEVNNMRNKTTTGAGLGADRVTTTNAKTCS